MIFSVENQQSLIDKNIPATAEVPSNEEVISLTTPAEPAVAATEDIAPVKVSLSEHFNP